MKRWMAILTLVTGVVLLWGAGGTRSGPGRAR
ncbi:MAG: hypothetical protein KatS3mg051_0151 [Anaerolineae bacterium]|nr:MAG: hypothetical protein KatS3mg051_0151 [Anaerolineae bacterium]